MFSIQNSGKINNNIDRKLKKYKKYFQFQIINGYVILGSGEFFISFKNGILLINEMNIKS